MIFTLENLLYSYSKNDRFSLGPLSLSLRSDVITALVGSNGSGKTTLIRVLLNELVNYGGVYSIDSKPVSDIFGTVLYDFGIGYAPEDPLLDEQLSGYEILCIVKEIHGIKNEIFESCIAQYRHIFMLESWFDTAPCKEYSQGMRRKISLMIAFLSASSYLIIDEPTNGLDPLSVFGIKKLLTQYKEQGKGVLVSSHMLDFVEKIADNIIILKKGTLAFAGTVQQLMESWPGKSLDEIYYHLFTGSDHLKEYSV
ncbi:MAG TPA: ABC transporter ATP-binding protein [Chitinispirillaceae bacterium]|nr:ABC transporter ATP-binding protein [Chitinispirillaceae bacterium]